MASTKQLLFKAILLGGLIAGTLDILAAIAQTMMAGRNPLGMLKFIASGIFGNSAFAGDEYAAYGLFFHFCIATIWSALLFILYPKIKFLSKNWIVTALVYGFFVWLMMNRVVLPISNTPPLPFKIDWSLLKSMAVIIVAVGLPLAYLTKRYYTQHQSSDL
jgi:hypothetical protein